jgi:hypothetical protein
MATRICIAALCCFLASLNAWEDHPDRDTAHESDQCFRDAQEQTGAGDQGSGTYSTDRDSCYDRSEGSFPSPGTHTSPDRDG